MGCITVLYTVCLWSPTCLQVNDILTMSTVLSTMFGNRSPGLSLPSVKLSRHHFLPSMFLSGLEGHHSLHTSLTALYGTLRILGSTRHSWTARPTPNTVRHRHNNTVHYRRSLELSTTKLPSLFSYKHSPGPFNCFGFIFAHSKHC